MDTEGGLVAKPTNNLCDREEEPHNLSLDGAEINPTCDCNVNHDAGERPYMDVPAKLLKLISNKYADHHPGPFEVHIEKYIGIHPPNMWFPISAIFLGKTIHTILPEIWEEAYDLIHLSNLKYSVKFSDRSTANKLVDALYEIRSDIFSHSGWIATIPNYKIFKQVVTRDIDAKTSPKDILEKLSPPPEWKLEWPKLISVEYLGKNTNMFLFTFDCIEPPSSAMYLEKRIQFCFYVPKVTRCLNCQQFGHLNIRCRNGILICEKCAKQGHSGNGCVNPSPKCINCFRRKFGSIDHFASSLSCPTFIEKIKIRIIMAKLACNHKDAFNILKNYGPYLDDKWFDVRIGSKINVHLNSPAENKDDNSKQPNSSNHASRMESSLQDFSEDSVHGEDSSDRASDVSVKRVQSPNRRTSNRRFPIEIDWWDSDCEALASKKREAHRAFKARPALENLNNYFEISKIVKNKLRKIRDSKLCEFFASFNINSDSDVSEK